MREQVKTIVVGNGITENLGDKIDEFDTVIRCNHYVIKGYEKDVGTKTDIWAIGGLRTFEHLGVAIVWNAYSSRVYEKGFHQTNNRLKGKLTETNPEWSEEICREMGMREGSLPRATTGLVAINIALHELGQPIYITGISNSPDKTRVHYWDLNKPYFTNKRRKDHDWEREFEWIEKKIKEGVLIRL